MQVLYIVSSPHGGSTLLSLVLGRHPAAANLGEVSFIPKLLAMRELCTCGRVLAECPQWSRVFDTLSARRHVDMRAAPYDLFLGDAIKSKDGSGLVDHDRQTPARRILAKARGALESAVLLSAPSPALLKLGTLPSVRASIRNTMELYRAAADAWGKTLVIDASKHPRKAPYLYLNDPDSVRILHLVRDGRGVLASRIKYMSAARAVERWRHYHKLTRRLLGRWVAPEHRRMLRYEDFAGDPERGVRDLCEWLGIDYTSHMLEFSSAATEHSAGGNPTRFRISGGIRAADERWREDLSGEQLALFDRMAGALNREFGYE